MRNILCLLGLHKWATLYWYPNNPHWSADWLTDDFAQKVAVLGQVVMPVRERNKIIHGKDFPADRCARCGKEKK